jgi:hypothetical protein
MTGLPAKGRLRSNLECTEDRRPKYGAGADALEIAHSRHVPGIGATIGGAMIEFASD